MITKEGRIISNQIGSFSDKDVKYGYITLETSEKEHFRLKIDNYTEYDTLDVGATVTIKAEKLGNTSILVARKIKTR